MKKTIDLGKYAYTSNKKVNKITIDMQLTESNIMSITGTVWNAKETDAETCGQCQDTINEVIASQGSESTKALWNVIYYLWNNYHLNNLHAGTPEQEKLLKQNPNRSYDNDVEFLKQHDMLTVPAEQADPYRKKDSKFIGEPYTYGYEWLTWPLPKEVVDIIKAILA